MTVIEAHCTAIESDGSASCTCGWRSPQSLLFDASELAKWHRLSIGATIDNPLLSAFLAPVTAAEIADSLAGSVWMAHSLRRDRLVAEYAWAIPTEPVLHRLSALSPICDLGCGTGYWASLLQKAGADVLAVDSHPPLQSKNRWHGAEAGILRRLVTIQHFTDIIQGNAETFEVPRTHTLMLCWPPYDRSMAATALARYRGDHVIYIGEGGSGCTGDEAFHNTLHEQWHETAFYEIPQWPGLHDAVYVYERQGSAK